MTLCGKLSSAVSLIERYENIDQAGILPASVALAPAPTAAAPPVAAPGSLFAEYMASRSDPPSADPAEAAHVYAETSPASASASAEAKAAPAVVTSADDGLAAVIYAEFAADVTYAEAALTAAMATEYAEYAPAVAHGYAEVAPAATFAEAASTATDVQDLVAQLRGMPAQAAPAATAPAASSWSRPPAPAPYNNGMPWSAPAAANVNDNADTAAAATSTDGFFEALDHRNFRQVKYLCLCTLPLGHYARLNYKI